MTPGRAKEFAGSAGQSGNDGDCLEGGLKGAAEPRADDCKGSRWEIDTTCWPPSAAVHPEELKHRSFMLAFPSCQGPRSVR